MIKPSWIFLAGMVLLGIALILSTVKQVVRNGDTVTFAYNLILEDGTVYYSSAGQETPKETLGQGTLLPGLEEQLIGMHVGESKTFTLSPEKAYGAHRPELVGTVDRSWLPASVEPVVGKQLQTKLEDGTQSLVTILSFTNTTLTLDANHPLAGKTLTLQIELLAIDKKPIFSNLMNPANLGWPIIALAAFGIGFVIFRSKKRTKLVFARKSLRSRTARLRNVL